MDLSEIVLYVTFFLNYDNFFKAFRKTIFCFNNDNNERYANCDFKKLSFMREKKTSKRKKNVNNLVRQAKIRKLKYVTRVLTSVTARSKCIVLVDVKAVHAINCVNFK